MYITITLRHIKLSADILKKRYLNLYSIKKQWLKTFVLCACVALVAACSSQPAQKSFVGPGEFDPQEAAKTRVSLGLTYLKNGNFSQAKYNLDKALEFAPRSGEANYAMAFYYQQVEEIARAQEYYQTAISYSRNDPDVLNSYGAFLCKQGSYEKAKDFFLRAVDSKSYISTAETYENLAICTQSQGLKKEAMEYFNSALNHQPTRSSSLFYLAQLHIETEQWEDAKKVLWKYERNAQINAESMWMSYEIAQGQNNIKSATEYADLLRSMYPNHRRTKVALAELGKFRPSMAVTQKRRSLVGSQEVSAGSVSTQQLALEQVDPQQAASQEVTTQVAATQEGMIQGLAPQQAMTKTQMPSVTNALSPQSVIAATPKALVREASSVNDEVVEDESIETAAVVSQTDVDDYQQIIEEMKQAAQKTATVANDEAVKLSNDTQTTVANSVSDAAGSLVTEGYHTVLPKENLYRISLKYNVKMKKLLEWNNMKDSAAIRIGTKLRVRDPIINEQ